MKMSQIDCNQINVEMYKSIVRSFEDAALEYFKLIDKCPNYRAYIYEFIRIDREDLVFDYRNVDSFRQDGYSVRIPLTYYLDAKTWRDNYLAEKERQRLEKEERRRKQEELEARNRELSAEAKKAKAQEKLRKTLEHLINVNPDYAKEVIEEYAGKV